MEDGCSKRFNIETVDFRPQDYGNGDAIRNAASTAANQSRQPSYSPSARYSPPSGSTSQSGPHEVVSQSEPTRDRGPETADTSSVTTMNPGLFSY
jgi:hypothetical protein